MWVVQPTACFLQITYNESDDEEMNAELRQDFIDENTGDSPTSE